MRRPRGPGGRFLTGDEIRALEQQVQLQESASRPQSANGTNGNPASDPVPAATEGVEA